MNKKTIAIYGKSGHAKVIEDIAVSVGYNDFIYIDDDKTKNVLSSDDFIKKHKDIPLVIAIGNNEIRLRLYEQFLNLNYHLPTLIHPSAIISRFTKIGDGCVVMPNVVVNADSSIACGVILNTSCVIEHDCKIEDFVHISPNATLSGNVIIKKLSHIGVGTCVRQNTTIGQNVVVGAGSVVVKDIESNCVAYGVPAKVKT